MNPRLTVLVVEDNPMIRDIMQDSLEDDGFIALSADSLTTAIATLEAANDIDAVFADIDLGDRGRGQRPDIEIIYTSGGAREDFAEERVEHASFVQKPYLPSQVCRLLRSRLSH